MDVGVILVPEPRRSAETARTAEDLGREHYDMKDHTRTGVAHTAGIGDDFVDWFAVAGPPEAGRRRFGGLRALGLDFCYVAPGSTGMPRDLAARSLVRLAQDVLPAVRR